MLMCELLTPVHHNLPVKVIIFNNSAFGVFTLEAESTGLPLFRKGVEFPNPDFAAFGHACGGHGVGEFSSGKDQGSRSRRYRTRAKAIAGRYQIGR